MPLILNIDTALERAGICLSEGEDRLEERWNEKQSDHASWIHTAIEEMFLRQNKRLMQLNAVAVTSGPGSYTGLRVGMATAKGICYALNIPLITETTLKLIAFAVRKEAEDANLICPMIDARRMEVFTTLCDLSLQERTSPHALILDEQSFAFELQKEKLIFAGNGSIKWKGICKHPNALFSDLNYTIRDLATVSALKFAQKDFSQLAYSEPFYIKSFYAGKENLMQQP